MHWKIYNIQTGRTIKAGLKDEEAAKDWLEENRPGREDNYMYEEMDEDEELEWAESLERGRADESGDAPWADGDDDDDFEEGRYTYKTEDDDEDPAVEGLHYEDEDDDMGDEF